MLPTLLRGSQLLSVVTAFALGACFAQLDNNYRAAAAERDPAPSQRAADLEFFEKKIRPLLVDNCYTCHSADTNSKGGLRVDDRNGLVTGGRGGPAVVPGKPEQSLLIRAVGYGDKKLQMPPKKQLTEEQVANLTIWIRNGAAWPEVELPADLGASAEEFAELRKSHWSWQPLREPSVPAVKNTAWPRDDLDRFVLTELEKRSLQPVGDAAAEALIRRVTFDLTGLPPTPEEIAAFVNDRSAQAYEKLLDRLLASPQFGERWGRHWLDVARYAESTGPSRNMPYPHAWRYRDYVIDAFQQDKPYDQFIREQIAGDLLPADSQERCDELLIATGFLALGGKDVNQRFKVRFTMDNIDEQIDTVTRSVLALTASCARCHDHKYDPIPAVDYYALAGIFHSTDLCAGVRSLMGGGGLDYYETNLLLRLGGDAKPSDEQLAEIEKTKAALAKARSELVALRDDPASNKAKGPEWEKNLKAARKKIDEIQAELVRLTDPAATGRVALGVREAATIGDTQLRVRGEAEKLGPSVPRGFLSAIAFPDQPQVNAQQSGRLELAQWLTHQKNPLTPRVMVNRVWQHLFGRGIVQSVDNFGVMGDSPSHPELLDHLASRFIRDGWSIKRLIRTIALSRTYRLSADSSVAQSAVDPANRYLWRHLPRRLAAEEIRDAMLATAGNLSSDRPEGSPAANLKVIELRDTAPDAKRMLQAAHDDVHRSIYLPLLRGLTPPALEVFDFAEQSLVTGSRDETTVPTQALYLLNDAFVHKQSRLLAERVLADDRDNPSNVASDAIDRLYPHARTGSDGARDRAGSKIHCGLRIGVAQRAITDRRSEEAVTPGRQDVGNDGRSRLFDDKLNGDDTEAGRRSEPGQRQPFCRNECRAVGRTARPAHGGLDRILSGFVLVGRIPLLEITRRQRIRRHRHTFLH